MANRTSAVLWSVSGLLVAVALWLRLGALPAVPSRPVRPDAGSLERLAEYVKPVSQAGPVRGEVVRAGRAVEDPFVSREPVPTRPHAAMTAGRRLSAILISPARRVAIIDDRLVQPGDRLSGGTRVAEIQRDRVVLVTPDGTRQVLRMNEGGDR